ncbi:MAG: RNA methyltransferase [Pseudomonadota bacterium]
MIEGGNDSPEYLARRDFFRSMLTVYGRKPVLEALSDHSLDCQVLHLAMSNRPGGILARIQALAEARGVAIRQHSRSALARISRNGKQDQGVAMDIRCPRFATLDQYLKELEPESGARLLALDSIHNPQNLGMIVRSAVAGGISGLLWPRQGTAAPGPLVIKSSAGTLYRAPVISCDSLLDALTALRKRGVMVCTLNASAEASLFDWQPRSSAVYVLGNETEGVSQAITDLADRELAIPMQNGVESLNVAVSAALVAFAGQMFQRGPSPSHSES